MVEPLRLYRQIAGQIATLIENGEYPVGSRLPAERELAALLGVSRTSVREAVISLEIAGLVEVRVGAGIFVTGRSARKEGAAQEVPDPGPGPFELLAARKLIEGEIAALAASSATVDDIAGLRENVERMESCIDDYAAREATDEDFHRRLAKATGNGSLELVVVGLWAQRAELWRRTQQHFHTAKLAERTVRDHAAILKAVMKRDAEGARLAMHQHLARVEREFKRDEVAASRPPRRQRSGVGSRA
jgi:DNA-binding FadR family transcriptional regulator